MATVIVFLALALVTTFSVVAVSRRLSSTPRRQAGWTGGGASGAAAPNAGNGNGKGGPPRRGGSASTFRRARRKLTYLSDYDILTELPQQSLLETHLAQAIAAGERFALMVVGINDFKTVNDSFGHHIGDLLLIETARRLEGHCASNDSAARLGGDSFAVLVHVGEREDGESAAQQLVQRLQEPVAVNGQVVQVSVSVGIALPPGSATDPATLLGNAKAAMGEVRVRGYGGYGFFKSGLSMPAQDQRSLNEAMSTALVKGQFYLVFQPKYSARDKSLVGVEALARWKHPERGMIGPDVFIPLAERSGLIVEFGAWALDAACSQMAAWHASGLFLQISVNLSVMQFRSRDLVDVVGACLARHQLAPEYLTLEITESIAMQDVEESHSTLRSLRDMGVRISIDDFGTGYSSLAYLKRLPASELKIDREFVRHLEDGREDAAIAAAIVVLGKTLGLTVVAEGVETQGQLAFLVRHGCDVLQGYLLGRPTEPENIPAMTVAHLPAH